MYFSDETIAAFAAGGLLAIIIPIAAIVIFKLRYKDTWLPSALIGAGTFLVFAAILESMLHMIMLPLVSGSTVLYCVYGCLAAGVFEETGRFIAYKLFMKKHGSLHNAVMMGLGHGGFEAILLFGVTMLSYFAIALTINTIGYEAMLEQITAGNPELLETAREQLEAISQAGLTTVAAGLYERVVAMTVHVSLSVVVYRSTDKGRLWLYPLAILLHALVDLFAVLYQVNVISSVLVVYILMTVLAAAIIALAIKTAKLGKKANT